LPSGGRFPEPEHALAASASTLSHEHARITVFEDVIDLPFSVI
jgi:hypothetical protein